MAASVIEKSKSQTERLVYLDLLRIVSIICMIMLHVSGVGMRAEIGSYVWNVSNVFDGITHFCVPVFVMISGTFLLEPSRDYPIKKLYKVKILRLLTAFLFWSLFYAVVNILRGGTQSAGEFFTDLIQGHFHLWFLFMIAGLYMLTPILRRITQDKKLTEYFLILCGVFMFGLSNISYLSLWSGVDTVANYINEKFNMDFVFGYVFYFVAGYYLKKYPISSKVKKVMYVLGAVSAVAIPLGTLYYSDIFGKNTFFFYAFSFPSMGLLSLAIFVFFKESVSKISFKQDSLKRVSFLSKHSFAVYLIHAVFIDLADDLLGLNCNSFNPLLSIPLITALVFAVSLAASYVIGKIPVLNKYIM